MEGKFGVAELLTIGAVASRTGVATSALRFYEDRGLIKSQRTESGHRRYARDALRRVSFILAAQRVGIDLDTIGRSLDELPAGRAPTRTDWTRLASRWAPMLDSRIAALERLRDGLKDCIGCGCLSLDKCGLRNPDDLAGSLGPGPRFLLEERKTPRKT